MTDLEKDPLANELRDYLSQVAAEPIPHDLPDRAVETAFVRLNRRRVWRGRLGASLLVTAVATAAAVALVVHLQRTPATLPPTGAAPTAAGAVTPSPAPTVSPAPSPTPAASPTPSPQPVDVAGAQQSALAMFVKIPRVLNDPQAGYIWSGGPSTARHLSAQVNARFSQLQSTGFFSDAGKCGEDYVSHSQNGLTSAPVVLSSVAGADGRVTVVIHREGLGGTVSPNLTAVMTDVNGAWLATDLASGRGPDASIFSANPNC